MHVLGRDTTIVPPGGSTAEGVPVFPKPELQIGISRSAQQLPSELHGHDFAEIAIIESGSAQYAYEGTESRIETGDVFIVPPYHAHQYTRTEALAVSNVLFYDDGSIPLLAGLSELPAYRALFQLEPALHRSDDVRGRLRLGGDRLRRLLAVVEQLYKAMHSTERGSSAVAMITFLKLVHDLCDAFDAAPPRMGRSLLLISQAAAYVDRHFREDLRVGELAGLVNLSRRSFQRHFRQATGMSVIHYISAQRLREACRLLKEGRSNVAETAYQAGFPDPNYFSRVFREKIGVTPKQYQRHAAAKSEK